MAVTRPMKPYNAGARILSEIVERMESGKLEISPAILKESTLLIRAIHDLAPAAQPPPPGSSASKQEPDFSTFLEQRLRHGDPSFYGSLSEP